MYTQRECYIECCIATIYSCHVNNNRTIASRYYLNLPTSIVPSNSLQNYCQRFDKQTKLQRLTESGVRGDVCSNLSILRCDSTGNAKT